MDVVYLICPFISITFHCCTYIYCPVKHVDSIYPFTSINANPYLLLYWIYPIYPFTFKIASYYLCICLLSLPYLPFYSQHLSNNHCRAWSSLSSLIPSLILHTSQVAKRQLWQIRVLCPFLGHKTLFYAQFLDIGHESVMLSYFYPLLYVVYAYRRIHPVVTY